MSDAPPAPPPADEPDRRLTQAVAILLMVVTIIAGAFGLASADLSDDHDDAARAAQDATVEMLLQRVQAARLVLQEQQAENAAAEQLAYARAVAARAAGDPDLLGEARAARDAGRRASAATALGASTSVLRDSGARVERFRARQEASFIRARELQEAYEDERQELAGQTSTLLAVIAVLAIALFLIGATLVVGQRTARRVFLATGLLVAAAATVWGVRAVRDPRHEPLPAAIDAYVRGTELRRGGFAELSEGSDRATDEGRALMRRAIAEYDTAIRLRPGYGRAYAGRAQARLLLAFSDPRGARGSARASEDYRRAIARGAETVTSYNNLALNLFLLGDTRGAIRAAEASVAAGPERSNSHETLASLLRYSQPGPTAAYRDQLAVLRRLWAERPVQVREREIARAIAGTRETAERFPRLAAVAAEYRADLERLAASLPGG